ncbi:MULTISPECIES: DNA repair exonuclease [unclassified Corynebacterium]|uniref:metallophosphoesterase family protein n=1 Tax=unclassified Corynebacterium TaxID=2624378 RepID=UPI0029C9EFBA|nr:MULTISPECIES: DNA repair exonuclease [unclassified Corynebacterium]WPF66993.1 DNA repair exonuclease [Corynebacterium sp. 22KM0430]WPF69481.1 DNA repair exonuclease [Corynebacterium sp. 21KM1197]
MAATTFIHTSDLQWGMTRWFLDADAQARFEAARLDAVRKIGEIARYRGADFVVMAGDIFDKNSLSRRTQGRALDALASMGVPVFLLPGNHDPLVADSPFYAAADIPGVTILRDQQPVIAREGVEVVGAPLKAKYASTDLVAQTLAGLKPTSGVRVAVGHGQVEGRAGEADPALIDLSRVESALAAGVIDYLALGDTHSTQQVGDSGRVWFSGAPEVTDFHDHYQGKNGGEVDSGNVLCVSIEKTSATHARVEVEKIPVGSWLFEALDAEVNTAEEVADFLAALEAYPHKERTAVKYSLRGTLGLANMRALEAGLERLEPVFAALYERRRLMDLHLAPNAEEIAGADIRGFAAAALEELVAADETDAVNLLLRLSARAEERA